MSFVISGISYHGLLCLETNKDVINKHQQCAVMALSFYKCAEVNEIQLRQYDKAVAYEIVSKQI